MIIWAMVAGMVMIEAAKMIGMTPPVLTRSGQVGALAAVDLAADDALGVGHRDAALAALDEDDEGDDGEHHRAHEDDLDRVPAARS